MLQDKETEDRILTNESTVTPSAVRQLVEKGFKINVERSPIRIFDDEDYEKSGASLIAEGSWPVAPQDHIIIGLKELPEESCMNSFFPPLRSKLTRSFDSPSQAVKTLACLSMHIS